MNYRDEAGHNGLLIELIKELDKINRLDLFCEAFKVPSSGRLKRAKRRKLFDVELTFSDYSCVIETKVDSNESGGWDRPYQTEQIISKAKELHYLKPAKYFFFLTYGTSEYYTKPYNNGPASREFRHIKLDDIASFLESALRLPLSKRSKYEEWLSAMRIEQMKRSQSVKLLKAFSAFRQEYLQIHNDIDFPNNRLTFCAPELAFPLFYGLAAFWNTNPDFHNRFGRVSLYPVARKSPHVHDSILNFWEMWVTGNPKVGRNLIGDKESFYFEINEDFNLNLKLKAEKLPDSLRDKVWSRLESVKWSHGVQGRRCYYKQSTFVLFEWDFGLLKNCDDYTIVSNNLYQILDKTITALEVNP